MKTIKFLAPLVLSCVAVAAFAQSQVRTIVVRGRPAQEVVGILGPLYAGRATLRATSGQIIVKSDEATFREIAKLTKQMDGAAVRSLRVTVRVAQKRDASAVRASIKGKKSIEASGVDAKAEGGSAQTITVMEGGAAGFRIGDSEHPTDLQVKARTNGNDVMLDIAQKETKGTYFQAVESSVSGRLGSWIEVGSVISEGRSEAKKIAAGDKRSLDVRSRVYVKVESL